ncbi:tRNA (cytosine(72)-C(5))-methyltransferase NSUN6 [Musca vetustissima]|uniref:tRNA (cytosine(72)-C(5))-methyltransferase NSUN6 n=1 Tax=Musca vetustissima TaxID=27455 RepID=UPI002AB6331C|nr:tRNA (cytosine(72)-C(5))-methyltransferase NSUN6 [Musca vetustissima]
MFYPKSPFIRYPLVESQLCKGNLTLLDDLLPWLCRAPSVTTYRVNLLKTTQETFKTHVEQILKNRYNNPPKVFSLPDLPEVVCISPTDHAPNPIHEQKEIIVDSCCGAAILRGAHIYSIGVLGMESGTQVGDVVNVYADLAGKCKKGSNVRYESDQKVYLGQGKVLMQRYQLYRPEGPQAGVAIEMLNTISGVPSIGDLSSTEALLQNLPSIICARSLNPQENETILDMCSAPGNKTTHLAELIHNRGVIVALDKTESKIKLVQEKICKNGLSCIKAYAHDSTQAHSETIQENDVDFKPPFKAKTFDRILLDAPCSALGNRPMLSSSISPKMLDSYPKVQKRLFTNAVALLKDGGTLVYSTCTINLEENEEIVVWALKTFPELELVAIEPSYGGSGWSCDGLLEEDRKKLQRFGPTNQKDIDTVGFFIAKFIKKC